MKAPFTKAVIIDDEPDGRNIVAHLLEQFFPGIQLVGQADSVSEGINVIGSLKPDLIFLDIEMPDGNAFDLLSSCKDWRGDVILITAFEDYAIKAIKASVLDYILKPVDEEEFVAAVKKVLTKRKEEAGVNQGPALLDVYKHLMIRKVRVPTLNGFSLVNVDDIVRCEASGNYTILFFVNQKTITACRKLGEYEEELNEYGFIRIHKKHLVKNGGYITLTGREVLEVSNRRKTDILHLLR